MNRETIGELSGAWTATGVLLGVVLVMLESAVLTQVGDVLVILGLLGLMPAMRFTWMTEG